VLVSCPRQQGADGDRVHRIVEQSQLAAYFGSAKIAQLSAVMPLAPQASSGAALPDAPVGRQAPTASPDCWAQNSLRCAAASPPTAGAIFADPKYGRQAGFARRCGELDRHRPLLTGQDTNNLRISSHRRKIEDAEANVS